MVAQWQSNEVTGNVSGPFYPKLKEMNVLWSYGDGRLCILSDIYFLWAIPITFVLRFSVYVLALSCISFVP